MAIRSPRLHNQAMAGAAYICIFRACWQRERWLKEISHRLINHWRSARRSCRDDKCNQTFARDEKRRRFHTLKRDGARDRDIDRCNGPVVNASRDTNKFALGFRPMFPKNAYAYLFARLSALFVLFAWQLSVCGFCYYHLMTKSAIT